MSHFDFTYILPDTGRQKKRNHIVFIMRDLMMKQKQNLVAIVNEMEVPR